MGDEFPHQVCPDPRDIVVAVFALLLIPLNIVTPVDADHFYTAVEPHRGRCVETVLITENT